jgi:hypothetical protein
MCPDRDQDHPKRVLPPTITELMRNATTPEKLGELEALMLRHELIRSQAKAWYRLQARKGVKVPEALDAAIRRVAFLTPREKPRSRAWGV